MRKTPAFIVLVAALALAGSAAATDFGANDDTGKYLGASAGSFFERLAATGLRTNVMTVRWDPARPEEIDDRQYLDAAIPLAVERGVRVSLALYGARPTTFTQDGGTPAAFAAWAASVARAYPQVRTFVVGNEPNQPRFWRPQFSPRGVHVAAASFGPTLAAAYDALKAVDPELAVVGIGLSPRGNDRPTAVENVSTSPVRFLHALGRWYRSSGRTAPLMDGLSFHPYPSSNADPPERGYVWPNAGVANLGRLRQAIWDAFAGTGQPTTVTGLKLYLDEVGWQVETGAVAGYRGAENVRVADEATQASIYAQLVRSLACDPSVAAVNLFGFVDDPDRAGFQAGLVRIDGTGRPAEAAVTAVLAETGGTCGGPLHGWRVARGVVGAGAVFGTPGRPRPPRNRDWSFTAWAAEGAAYRAGIFPAGLTRTAIERRLAVAQAPFATAHGRLSVARRPAIRFPGRTLPPGRYVYALRLQAEGAPTRTTTLVSAPFRVRAGGA